MRNVFQLIFFPVPAVFAIRADSVVAQVRVNKNGVKNIFLCGAGCVSVDIFLFPRFLRSLLIQLWGSD